MWEVTNKFNYFKIQDTGDITSCTGLGYLQIITIQSNLEVKLTIQEFR